MWGDNSECVWVNGIRVSVRMMGFQDPLKATLLGLPSFTLLLWVSQHCDSKLVAAPWFNGIINRAQTMLPACLYACLLIPPPSLSLFSSVVSPTAVEKWRLWGMGGRRDAKKRGRWIYLCWTLGKNHSVKYAKERAVTECCHWDYSSMAACSSQWRLYTSVSQAQYYLCSQLSSEKWSGTSTKTPAHSSKWHTHLWPQAFIMHRVGINWFCSNKISLIIQLVCHSHVLFSFLLFSGPAFFKYAKRA